MHFAGYSGLWLYGTHNVLAYKFNTSATSLHSATPIPPCTVFDDWWSFTSIFSFTTREAAWYITSVVSDKDQYCVSLASMSYQRLNTFYLLVIQGRNSHPVSQRCRLNYITLWGLSLVGAPQICSKFHIRCCLSKRGRLKSTEPENVGQFFIRCKNYGRRRLVWDNIWSSTYGLIPKH